jgi:cobalt transporter subunit CbtA
VNSFNKLISIILLAGTSAGLLLFTVQHFTTFPLIEKSEVYESAADKMPGMQHEAEGWKPAEGVQRTLFTVLTTVLAAIGFAALLFGIIALKPVSLDWKSGALWGFGAFLCVDLAPAAGLPPLPPGVPVADIYARQLWWLAAVISMAIALWLLLDRRKALPIRLSGLLVAILPDAIGAPVATGANPIPVSLIHQFALASILTTGIFWVALGSIGGLLYRRFGYVDDLPARRPTGTTDL